MSSALAQKVKERISIVEVVGERVELKHMGASWKAKCPFHHEKTPSFVVSPDRGTFCCFGCGEKGDAISFVQKFDGLSFREALKRLAERAGVPFDEGEFGKGEDPALRSRRERLLGCVEAATDAYRRAFLGSALARKYAEGRGMSEETLDKFRVGFAPDEWRYASEACKAAGYTEEEIEAAGIAKHSDDGKTFYDRFRGRLIFPIFDGDGKVIAFAGRILKEFEKEDSAKYINSPETDLFKKSRALYGMPWARGASRRMRCAILVEGQVDLILCHQAGYENAVATSGTALTSEHLAEVAKWTENLVIAYDGDGAGLKAAERAIEMALARGMHVKVAQIAPGKDPADIILENPEAWRAAIREARHVIDHLIAAAVAGSANSRDAAVAVAKAAAPLIASLESPVEKAHFVGKMAAAAGVPEAAAWEEVKRAEAKGKVVRPVPHVAGADAAPAVDPTIELRAAESSLADPLVRAATVLLWQRSLQVPVVDAGKFSNHLASLVGSERLDVATAMAEAAGEAALFAIEKAMQAELEDVAATRRGVSEVLHSLARQEAKTHLADSRRRISVDATETAIREHERLIREEKRLGARDEAPEPDVFVGK